MPANMIDVGPNVPRRRNAFLRGLGSIVLKLAGWKVTGKVADEPRFVLTGGPHTSNWDFIFALMTLWKLELDVHWIGKHTIFRWPFRSLFTYFGGIPVDRRKPGTLFRDVLQGFSGNRPFIFALSPEGTRSKVERFKPGFHRIARKADVPILPVGVDFGEKEIHFGELIHPEDDFQADAARLRAYWENFRPKYPDQF